MSQTVYPSLRHKHVVVTGGGSGIGAQAMATDMKAAGSGARLLAQQCLNLRVEPQDIAAMVAFLASDDARMRTAHEYFVDAGWR